MRRVFSECNATSSPTSNMSERERERDREREDGARVFTGLFSSLERKRGN